MRFFLTLFLFPLVLIGAAPAPIKVPLVVLNPSVIKFGWNEDELIASAQKRDKFLSSTDVSLEYAAFDQQLPELLRKLVHTGRPIVTTIPILSASNITAQAHPRMSGIYIVMGLLPQADPQFSEELPLLSTEVPKETPKETPKGDSSVIAEKAKNDKSVEPSPSTKE